MLLMLIAIVSHWYTGKCTSGLSTFLGVHYYGLWMSHEKKKCCHFILWMLNQAVLVNCNTLQAGYQISPNYQAVSDTKLLFLLSIIKELKGSVYFSWDILV